VSGVGPGIGVLDGGPRAPRGRKGFEVFSPHWFEWRFGPLKQKCIWLVREKLTIFPHGQYINGIVVYSSFLRCTLLRDQSWNL